MKGNKKILVAALLVLLLAVSFTTYAIYKTSVAGNANVTAATWDVVFKNGATTLTNNYEVTLDGSDCTNNHVVQGKIAPGATCTKQITLDASSAEVDVTYEVTTGTVTAEKSGSTVDTSNANTFTASLSPSTGTIAYNAATKTATLTLTVSWAGTEETTTTDPADTALSGATITVPVTLTAKQVVGA
ncbi:MAG: hypothetical protein IKF19_04070 [Bacilli bacterium]|nr:hypothetical protein [Bacilli bacterium]